MCGKRPDLSSHVSAYSRHEPGRVMSRGPGGACSLGNALVDVEPQAATGKGAVVCCERLGGLLDFYRRNVDRQGRIQ
jgi:hypothetical protein